MSGGVFPRRSQIESEADLVLFAKAGDRCALEALLERVYPALNRYVASLVGSTAADDVVQDSLVQACRKLEWLEDPAYFRAWLFRIASRLAFANLRKARRWRSIEEDLSGVPQYSGPSPIPAIDWDRTFASMLDQVSPASRAVLQLHYGNDLTLEEIAAVLEIPVGTVKSRLSYGVSALRQRLRNEER